LLGGLVVSIVSVVLTVILKDEFRGSHHHMSKV
jgi:hypothetical protein